jgi:hypothetical protein
MQRRGWAGIAPNLGSEIRDHLTTPTTTSRALVQPTPDFAAGLAYDKLVAFLCIGLYSPEKE